MVAPSTSRHAGDEQWRAWQSGGAPLELAVNHGPGYPEQLRQFSLRVFPGVVQRQKMLALCLG
jgi:hypothetical protein